MHSGGGSVVSGALLAVSLFSNVALAAVLMPSMVHGVVQQQRMQLQQMEMSDLAIRQRGGHVAGSALVAEYFARVDAMPEHGDVLAVNNASIAASANTVPALLQSIRGAKCQQSVDYSPVFFYPPLQWSRQAGIYDSFVHLNFHGEWPQMALLRNLYYFPDDNAFVTMFVVHSLMEVRELLGDGSAAGSISDEELLSSIEAIGTHHDKNRPEIAPLLNFWNSEDIIINGTVVGHRATPPNINVPLSQLGSGINMIIEAIKVIGLDKLFPDFPFDTIAAGAGSFARAFGIPADSDDTGCNMALGAKLWQLRSLYPKSYAAWQRDNQDGDASMIKTYLKYAYRPFVANNYVASSIDPRTYVWLHPFLLRLQRQELSGDGQENSRPPRLRQFALITTWMQSIDEVLPQTDYQRMPFNVNNVDLSVSANGLFGILSYLIMNPAQLDGVTTRLVLDNVELLAWAVETRIVIKYPSLSLLYYPPKFAFYWFVARLVTLADDAQSQLGGTPLGKLLQQVSSMLSAALQKYGSRDIISLAQRAGPYQYWDDFLGNGDSQSGGEKRLAEDRVFSSSMALNALIDIWTRRQVPPDAGAATKLAYVDSTPPSVVQVINSAMFWLKDEAHKYPKENAFFSASVKNGGGGNAMYYPHNTFRMTNGTAVGPCSQYKDPVEFGLGNVFNVVAAVTGIIPPKLYERLVDEQECLGVRVPVESYSGNLNCEDCIFPYWSSPVLTNAMHLLAEAKFTAITAATP